MMASVPVPPELLLPITKSFSNAATSHPNRSSDPEPWRCRRTDGKKWRCSRDVAPHQKYCERHSHKNRPRSRKPVELPADYILGTSKTTATLTTASTTTAHSLNPHHQPPVNSCQTSSHFITHPDQDPASAFPSTVASAQPFDHPRCLDWFMRGEAIPNANSNQEWHHQHQHNTYMGLKSNTSSSSNNDSGSMDSFQLKHPTQYSAPQHCSLLLMEGAVDPSCGQQTRRFIDAWSDVDESSGNRVISSYNSSRGKTDLPMSSLTLAMRGGEGGDYSVGGTRMGEKPHWMNVSMSHHGLWMGSPPGGPLAEALCLGSSGAGVGGCGKYQTSPRGCSSVTTTTTSSRSSSKDEGQEELNFIS